MMLAGRPLELDDIRRNLETRRLGKTFQYLSEIDSTNVFARERARRGAPEGEVIIAEAQRAGRGRLGRSWVSPPCGNLYFSIILRPRLPAVYAPQITLMAAVALAETVEAFILFPPDIKWPNDILVRGKKLAGVLVESSCEGDHILFVVLGIGVNINFPREMMPEEIRHGATSILALTHRQTSREDFMRRLIQNLDQWYGVLEETGFSAIAPRWEAYFGLRGKKVKVEAGGQRIVGRAAGIDLDGALLVQDDSGLFQRVVAGDVIPL